MSTRKFAARFLLTACGLKNLHGSVIQSSVRSFLDEIDLQVFRETHACPAAKDRVQMYRIAHESGTSADPIVYLEFGVYRGESLRNWLEIDRHSESRFYGFDSFEGLPDDWTAEKGKGFFKVDGRVPQINDPRLTFIKGWFNDTLPSFVNGFASANRMIIHLDGDLYQSTLLPLIYLDRFIKPGTILMFDEFYDREHEFKAFRDYLRIAPKDFRVVSQMDNFAKVAIQIR